MDIKFYEVLEDGTLNEENDFIQESTKVIIIVDDQFKRIYLWKGANSGIKKKFIGSRAAAELRKTYYGFAYRLSVIEEGDETQEFEFTIKRSRGEATVGVIENTTRGIPTNPSELGLEQGVQIKLSGTEPTKKIMYTDKDKADISQFAGARATETQAAPRPKRPEPKPQQQAAPQKRQPQRTILSEMMGTKEPKIIRPAPGTHEAKRYETATPAPQTAAAARPTPQATPPPPTPRQDVNPKEAFALIQELGVPAGYERDLVIVGTGVYKQQGNDFLIPPDPPEGVFLAHDRVPRIIIENGIVKVVEVLKKIETKTKEKEEVKLEQDIEDLMSTFQIEIE
ncbi:MAG: hypothetical protein DRP02_03625 [Candidatus Gerdarchaeota archaeon]|nr:MAG: hypothetical protein DRO63_07585 [Candidatus Gerdarchaeota archaeon]RLI71858.1 MAG: hypothetical protein DRP02_03625 [Candidatus Gerdarchaeota archaeon]